MHTLRTLHYGALQEDIQAAAGSGGVSTHAAAALKTANEAWRQEQAAKGLTTAVRNATRQVAGPAGTGLTTRFNPAQVATWIDRNPKALARVPVPSTSRP